MPDPWMPGLVHDPGNGAGYSVGRNRMEIVKVHKTAGNASYNVVKNGVAGAPSTLAQFLVPYVGVPWQFTEADALCYDSGPYNDDGPGIEIEAPVTGGPIRPGLSEFRDLSPSQIEWTGKIIRWLHDEWGVPLALYDGPRFQATATGWRGFVNHGDLDDQRTDGITREEWNAMVVVAPPIDWAAIAAYVAAQALLKQRSLIVLPVQTQKGFLLLVEGVGGVPLATADDYIGLCTLLKYPTTGQGALGTTSRVLSAGTHDGLVRAFTSFASKAP